MHHDQCDVRVSEFRVWTLWRGTPRKSFLTATERYLLRVWGRLTTTPLQTATQLIVALVVVLGCALMRAVYSLGSVRMLWKVLNTHQGYNTTMRAEMACADWRRLAHMLKRLKALDGSIVLI